MTGITALIIRLAGDCKADTWLKRYSRKSVAPKTERMRMRMRRNLSAEWCLRKLSATIFLYVSRAHYCLSIVCLLFCIN